MTVRNLIERLADYNPNAEVGVVANGKVHKFIICFAGPEGVTRDVADELYFDIGPIKEEIPSTRSRTEQGESY